MFWFGLAYTGAPGSSVSSREAARLFAVLSWAAAGFVGTVLLAAVLANVDAGDLSVVALPAGTILDALGVATSPSPTG
ncbi:hypothetical protein ACVGVM_01690 [Pseudonocardia bannensis]|uniref:Uncharacterized protein n=1 Tax=Pseudonocardia bannensis TaxID=630973 RepID=A0A848DDP7_9PSEU|nr:hypothetical protein [Pseudonocardia bannensis]NMH90702.1 hypothetical protein [Pseudonocardia bannensis]